MSYELIGDSGESLGQFASGMGYAALIAAGKAQPALHSLFLHGGSYDVPACVTALRVMEGHDDSAVGDTARALAILADGQEWIVISNGVVSDPLEPAEKSAHATLRKSSPPIASPDDNSPAAVAARRLIRRAAEEALTDLRIANVDDIVAAYENEASADAVVEILDFGPLDGMVEPVSAALRDVLAAAGQRALEDLHIDDTAIVDLVNDDAILWADTRGAELVGKKWVDDELVDNPDARWAISESTRDDIRELVSNSYRDGVTPRDLAKQLQEAYDFSLARAKVIAQTETAKASVSGSLMGWRRSGVVQGKSWQVSDDYDQDDECGDNEDAGVIALDDDFPSGDDGPPAHPSCRCALVPELYGEEGGADETGETADEDEA